MALVEPIVGHLLSQYAETVNEGLEKIRKHAAQDAGFAVLFLNHPQGVQAMKSCLGKSEFTVNVLDTLCALITCIDNPLPSRSTVSRGQQRGARLGAIREFCSGESFTILRKALATLSDATLPVATAALRFLGLAGTYAPKMLLARFNNKLPLHLACFRSQLPYSQRRIRLARLLFLLKLAETRQGTTAADVLCTHGFLTSVFEDAAEVLQEGTQQGLEAGKAALRAFQDHFITSQAIPAAQKRTVLMGQRNIFRLLVRALEVPAVAEDVAEVMYHMVMELVESPSDYASSRVDAVDGRGMPNFPIFFLLRQLRPNVSALASRIVLFILSTAPDLIRPYFARVSGHLADEGSLLHRVAPSTARVATLNLLTRIFTAPVPYHLLSRRATLEPVSAKASTFYAMSPRDVADEVCPQWVAEYVHKIINGSTNLMTLSLALQLTEAALARAKVVLALVAEIQREQTRRERRLVGGKAAVAMASAAAAAAGKKRRRDGEAAPSGQLDEDDVALFTAEDAQEAAEDFDARVRAQLLTALPRREEFWHRMTQQLQPALVELYKRRRSGNSTGGGEVDEADARKTRAKVEFVYQRMLLLMQSFTDVFGLRVSWLSAAPVFLPSFAHPVGSARGHTVIGTALLSGNDALCQLSPRSVSALCGLLVAALARGVPMPKIHHITMSNPKGGITEWPLLLSLLLWAVKHRSESDATGAVQEAVAWVAKVVQWVVHGVTVRQGCEFDEALLWVLFMEEEAIPCFLHMLNHLLQRSLSKAADRVTEELRGSTEASHRGLLLAASEAFVTRTEEKMKGGGGDGGDGDAEVAATGAGKKAPAKNAKGRQENGAASVELWVEHLHACLPVYKQVMREVSVAWPTRRETVSAKVMTPIHASETKRKLSLTDDGCGRARIFQTSEYVSQASSGSAFQQQQQQQQALHHRLTVKPPAHQLLKTFCRTLADPVASSVDGVGAAPAAVSVEETALLALLSETVLTAPAAVESTPRGKSLLTELTQQPALPPSLWFRMSSLCWTVAGRVLADLDRVRATAPSDDDEEQLPEGLKALHIFSHALLRTIAKDESGLGSVLTENPEGDSVAFFVLLLSLLRVELLVASHATATATVPMEASHIQALERVVLSVYTATLSTPDRIRYAALLSLHYLQQTPAVKAHRRPSATTVGGKGEEEDDMTDAESDRDTEENESADRDSSSSDSEVEGSEEHGNTTGSPYRQGGARATRYMAATVPQALITNRYLIAQHEPAPFVTPEADMLAYLIGSLTEQEIQSLALRCPARLHNALRSTSARPSRAATRTGTSAGPQRRARDNGVDLLLSVFPELSCAEDADVVQRNESVASTQLDPRYLLPLLHTVTTLPGPKYRYLCLRCTPILVRALSFTTPSLRRYAMCALLTVAQMPHQRYTTLEGATSHAHQASRRIIASFARLRMVQLAEKHGRRPHRGGRHDFIPRMPGPLSAFLTLSLDAIANFDDRLHNHFVAFLNEPKAAFAATVPFAAWLSSFPIDAISAPLMIKQQEEVQRTSSMVTSSIAQSSAEEAMADLRRNTPPQLGFMLRLVEHACGTIGDAIALVHSECTDRLMLLSDLVTSSASLRHDFIACLSSLCGTSLSIAALLALRSDSRAGGGGVLPWLLTFLGELNREYGNEVAPYSEQLYTDSLRLLLLLCRVVVTTTTRKQRTRSSSSHTSLHRYHGQVAAQLALLHRHLLAVGVTAKETLDTIEACVSVWARAAAGGQAQRDSTAAAAAATSVVDDHPVATSAGGKRARPTEEEGPVTKKQKRASRRGQETQLAA